MTPTAWNMPSLTVSNGVVKEPRSAKGVRAPCMTTVATMMPMLIRASVLAFANYIVAISAFRGRKKSHRQNYHHALLKRARKTYLGNISIQCQRVTNAQDEDNNNKLPVAEEVQHGDLVQVGPDGAEDGGDGVADDDAERDHAAEREGPLGDADGDEPRLAEAVLDRALEAAGAAELAVDDDEPDRPVDDHRQPHEQRHARHEPRVLERVRLPDDARADDAVRHVHERRLQPRLGPRALALRPAVHVVVREPVGDRHRRRLDVGQERPPRRAVWSLGALGVEKVERVAWWHGVASVVVGAIGCGGGGNVSRS